MRCAIVLAAGESRRMGANKMLLPFGGSTVIGHVVDQISRSVIDQILVVVGYEGAHIAEALSGRAAAMVENSDYSRGMLSSVRRGLCALPPACEIVMVIPGDQASIDARLVDEMAAAFAKCGKGILVPVCDGQRGHPLAFSAARYKDEILARYDDVGLRGLLWAHPDDVFEMGTQFSAALSDMDVPEDYRRALAALD